MTLESGGTTLEGMLAQARAIAPGLRERRLETDELRRLPDSTVAEIDRLGILGAAVPAELGGTGTGPEAIFDLAFELGKGCGSTAWCAGNWAIHNFLLTAFPKEAQQECFGGERLPRISTGFSPLRAKATPARGGAVLDGSWDFVSGVDHADWVIVVAAGERGPLMYLVPREELRVADTWHTSGLRGTGSKDAVAEGVFVPGYRTLSLSAAAEAQTPGREIHDSPFLRVPLGSFFGAGVLGALLGIATGALDEFVRRTAEKIGGATGIKVGDRTDVHLRIGLAASNIEAAMLMIRSTFAEVRAAGESGAGYTLEDRVRWRRRPAWAGKLASESMALLFKAGGAHVLWLEDRLNQAHRDLTAASQHYSMQWDGLFIDHGRVVLGMDATSIML